MNYKKLDKDCSSLHYFFRFCYYYYYYYYYQLHIISQCHFNSDVISRVLTVHFPKYPVLISREYMYEDDNNNDNIYLPKWLETRKGNCPSST